MTAGFEVVWPLPGSHRGGVNGGALLPPRDQKGDYLSAGAPDHWGRHHDVARPHSAAGHRVTRVGVRHPLRRDGSEP